MQLACNPGPMEYRGVYTCTGSELFHFSPIEGRTILVNSSSSAWFSLLQAHKMDLPIYSDVLTPKWVHRKSAKLNLSNGENCESSQLIQRADFCLHTIPLQPKS